MKDDLIDFREQKDYKYRAKVGILYLQGDDFTEDPEEADVFESETEPRQKINQLKKDRKYFPKGAIKMEKITESHAQGICPICGERIYSDEGCVKVDGVDGYVHDYHCTDESLEAYYDFADEFWSEHSSSGMQYYNNSKNFDKLAPKCELKDSAKDALKGKLNECKVRPDTSSFDFDPDAFSRKVKRFLIDDVNLSLIETVQDPVANSFKIEKKRSGGAIFEISVTGQFYSDIVIETSGSEIHGLGGYQIGARKTLWAGQSFEEFVEDFYDAWKDFSSLRAITKRPSLKEAGKRLSSYSDIELALEFVGQYCGVFDIGKTGFSSNGRASKLSDACSERFGEKWDHDMYGSEPDMYKLLVNKFDEMNEANNCGNSMIAVYKAANKTWPAYQEWVRDNWSDITSLSPEFEKYYDLSNFF